MNMRIDFREKKNFAFTFKQDKEEALKLLNSFLDENGVKETKYYFLEMSVTQRGVKTVTYIEYAEVPDGISKKGEVQVSKVPDGEELLITMTKEEYESFELGNPHPEIDDFLKGRKLRSDVGYIFPYIEIQDETYIIHSPVK